MKQLRLRRLAALGQPNPHGAGRLPLIGTRPGHAGKANGEIRFGLGQRTSSHRLSSGFTDGPITINRGFIEAEESRFGVI